MIDEQLSLKKGVYYDIFLEYYFDNDDNDPKEKLLITFIFSVMLWT